MPWDSPIASKSSLFIVVSDSWESMFTDTLNRCYKVFHTLGVEFPLSLRTSITLQTFTLALTFYKINIFHKDIIFVVMLQVVLFNCAKMFARLKHFIRIRFIAFAREGIPVFLYHSFRFCSNSRAFHAIPVAFVVNVNWTSYNPWWHNFLVLSFVRKE